MQDVDPERLEKGSIYYACKITPTPISTALYTVHMHTKPNTTQPPQPQPQPTMSDPNKKPPKPAYYPTCASSPLHPPTALYASLAALPPSSLQKTQDFTIPPRSGRAWRVPAGSLFRLSTPEGPQVGDLNLWNAHDARERFWAARTRQLQGSHVTVGDRLWSCLPFMRGMVGVVGDGCAIRDGVANGGGREGRRDERGGVTVWGGRCHDLLGTRCDPYGKWFCFSFPF